MSAKQTEPAPTDLVARLMPYSPKRGHKMRQYVHVPSGKKFEEKRGWYPITRGIAAYLATVRQSETDPDAPLAFQILTLEEAKAIDIAERKSQRTRRNANDLTSNDLRSGSSNKLSPLSDEENDEVEPAPKGKPPRAPRSMS